MIQKYSAYAVIFDMNGNVIVGLKNNSSLFYSGVRFPTGQRVNGAGRYCFPGGSIKYGEYANAAAARELYEETRYDAMNLVYDAPYYDKVDRDPVAGIEYIYYGIYFKVPPQQNINVICNTINTTLQNTANLVNGPTIPAGVDWSQYPIDNELASCQVVPINTLLTPNNVYFDPRSNATGWFYNIASYLSNRIPNSQPNPLPNPTPLITPFPNP